MTKLKRIASGFFWNQIGRSLEYVLIFLFSALIARKLGAEINGIYAMVLSIVYFLFVISSFGLETAISSTFPKLFGENIFAASTAFRKLLIFRILSALGIGLIFYLFRYKVLELTNISHVVFDFILVVFFYFVLRSITSLFISFLTAFFQTRTTSFISVAIRIAELVAGFFIIQSGYGLDWIFLLLTTTALIQVGILSFVLRKELFSNSENISVQSIITLGGKFWLNTSLEFLFGKQAIIILLGVFSISLTDIGFFDVAYSFAQVLNVGLTMGFFGISIAAFSTIESKEKTLVKDYWESLNRALLLLVVPVFIFVIVFAEILIPFVYSSEYSESVLWVQIFSVIFLITRILGGGIAADYLHAKGQVKPLLISSAASGVISIVLAVLLIKYFAVLGAIAAVSISAITISALHLLYVRKFIDVKLQIEFTTKLLFISILSASVAFLICQFVNDWDPIFSFGIFFFVLLVVFNFVKPFKPSDTENLSRIDERLHRAAKWFTKNINPELSVLTDRQKWAFAWLPQTQYIVDIGCSNRPLIKLLQLKSDNVIGVDTDIDALKSLNNQNPNTTLIQAKAENLPLRSNIADAVLLLDVLEHTQDEKMVISEAWRILKPNGLLILSVPYKGLFSFLDPENVSRKIKSKINYPYHKHYSFTDMRRLFFRLFKIERKHYGGLFLSPITFGLNNYCLKHLKWDLSKFLNKVGDIDYDISWGRMSYNLIIKARKI